MTEAEKRRRARAIAIAEAEQRQKNQQPKFKVGSLRENIIGEGEVDTVGEALGEAIRSGAAGATRGVKGILDLPETLFGLSRQGVDLLRGQEVTPLPQNTLLGGTFEKGVDALTGLVGDPNAMDFKGTTRPSKFAGTVGEFLGGAGAITQLTKPVTTLATVAGVGSEAAGQLTEDTPIEPFARLTGALVTPYAGSKTLTALQKQSSTRPTIEALKQEKDEAYRLVSRNSDGFSTDEVDNLIQTATRSAFEKGFFPQTDATTQKALDLIGQFKGKTIFMDDLDKVRRRLGKLYKQANDEVAILSIIKSIDDTVASKADTNSLVNAARAANSKYSKSLLLETAFEKSRFQTSSTGSGGNLVNKYRQALTSIITNPKKSVFFSSDEKEAMKKIIEGNVGSNTLRLIGKLSPGGNGLMTALNVGAIVHNPALLGVTITAGAAKSLSEKQIIKATEKLRDLVAAGGYKKPTFAELRGAAVEMLAPRLGGVPATLSEPTPEIPQDERPTNSILDNLSNINLPTTLSPSLLR